MKLVLDACVLYPTVMREMLLGVAAKGVFQPVWSERILEEWARAAARIKLEQEVQARGEIALVRAVFPDATVPAAPGLEARLWLPDNADIHVLATAVSSSADGIVTLNAKDFPRGLLAEEGLSRLDPDGFLATAHAQAPEIVQGVADSVLAQARALSDKDWHMRPLLKKARLPRLGKVLAA